MYYQERFNNSAQNKTTNSITTLFGSVKGFTALDVATDEINELMDEVINEPVRKPFKPWYATVNKQPIPLSADVKAKIYNNASTSQSETAVVESADFWCELAFGHRTKILSNADLSDFLEAPTGSTEQLETAERIGEKTLAFYTNATETLTRNVSHSISMKTSLVSANLATNWHNSSSAWEFDLTLDEIGSFGEENYNTGASHDGFALRIQHDSIVSALLFDLDLIDKAIAPFYYRTISSLSLMNRKTLVLDAMRYDGEMEEQAEALMEHGVTKEQIEHLATLNDTALDELLKINPEMVDFFEEEHQVYTTCQFMLETTFNEGYASTNYDCDTPITDVRVILSEMLSMDKQTQSEHQVLIAILQTVIEFGHEIGESNWEDGSDTSIESFAYISFGSKVEKAYIEVENEHRQSVGEDGALRLNLMAGKTDIETIENIALADQCLVILDNAIPRKEKV